MRIFFFKLNSVPKKSIIFLIFVLQCCRFKSHIFTGTYYKKKLLQGGTVTNSPCIGLRLRWSQMELGWGVQTEGVSGL